MRFKTFISQKTKQAKTGIKKVSDTVKLHSVKSNLNDELSDMYDTLGKIRYDELTGKGDNTEYALKVVEEISRILTEIEDIENELRSLNGRRLCSSCGKEAAKNVAFCPYCGTKLDTEESPAEAEPEQMSFSAETEDAAE